MLTEKQIEDFRESISQQIQKWQTSGYISVKLDDQVLFDASCGLADRETGQPVTDATRYCYSGCSRCLIGLCYLLLCDRKIIRPSDKLSAYIPEYKHAERITLRQLVEHTSGVPDYFYSRIMIALQNDPDHTALSERERYALELALPWRDTDIPTLLSLIGDDALEFEPGLRCSGSESNMILLAEAISRAAHKPYQELLSELVFKPLHMDGVRFESGPAAARYGTFRQKEFVRVPEQPIKCAFTIGIEDVLKLQYALCGKKLLSAQSWKKALKFNEDGDSAALSQTDGYAIMSLDGPGENASLYFSQELNLRFCHVSNTASLIENDSSGNWNHFRKVLRSAINIATTYPHQARIVPFGKKNWLEACDLKVREDQADFVSDARTSIACALAYKSTHRAYVMQEGDRAVGLLILEMDKKKEQYWVDIVLIDQRYQGRGYGKIMVGWGVEELKRHGAKQLSIGVNRFNIPAQRLYASLGFKPAEVFEGGMMMRINLEKDKKAEA